MNAFVIWLIIVCVTFIPQFLYIKKEWFKFFYHDILKWHEPDNSPHWNDGCSTHSVCKYCGQDIMQDSQGNWF